MSAIEPLRLDGVVPYPDDVAERYRSAGHWTDETLADILFASVEAGPDRTAVIAGETAWTYRELGDRVLRAARGLQNLGIERGDRVVVHLPNVPEYLVVVFALFELGALPVFALAAHGRRDIEHFVSFAEARLYITSSEQGRQTVPGLVEAHPSLRGAIVVSTGAPVPELEAEDPREHEQRSLPEDIAFLQLSGGTTGQPKMIPRTHADYLYSVRESNRICGVDARTVQLVALPISHNFTMSSPGVLGAILAGGTIVLAPHGAPDIVFGLIERHRVTQVCLVPPLVLTWLNSPLVSAHDLSSLETIQVGGAKFGRTAAARVRPELGARLQQVFGMAEGLVNYTRLDDDEETIVGTQGRPISADDEVRVVDSHGRDVAVGEPGDLLTRGPYTIRGYFRAPEHNARSFTPDGYYRTGDIVRRDERGYLTVMGRSKDLINCGGEKVAPSEIEDLLLGHDTVHDASVVGIPDDALGERIKAFVIARAGTAAPRAIELKRFLRARGIAEFKVPHVIEFVDVFPHTAVGKVSKRDQR